MIVSIFYILRQMGFKVSDISYSMICKGFKSADRFGVKMDLDIILTDYQVDIDWIKDKMLDMKKTMDLDQVSERTPHCENFAHLKLVSNFF